MPSNPSGLAPAITATGIAAGNFAQWQAYLVAQYQSIYGIDSYLGNDSQDGQYIGVIAQALADVCASAVAVYNSFSPATAQGAGLASNVKINGLKKQIPSPSTVTLIIGGQANSTITNGQAIDVNKVIWNLPASVTIPNSGTINVLATCATPGAVTAANGTITGIQTPTFGWQTVTNASAATVGAPVEKDAALRVRQAASVSLPSVTIFEGIVASLEQVAGVTRVKGYENNTGSADGNGIPRNTLYFIVEGGAQADIFNSIFQKITPGIGTMGSISTTITDANGSTRLLKYDVPVNATMSVAITVKALAGWQISTESLIATALVNYFQALPGGANISFLGLPAIALLPGTPFFGTFAITAMTIKKNSGSFVSADIQLAFNEMAVSAAANIGFTVT
jgi:uncharacterized phage protein gp47/JayE